MRRKIAAMTAAVFLLQCILPVYSESITNNLKGKQVLAAENVEDTEMVDVSETQLSEAQMTEAETAEQETSETKIHETEQDESEAEESHDYETESSEVVKSEDEISKDDPIENTELGTEAPESEIHQTETSGSEASESETTDTEMSEMESEETYETEIFESEEKTTESSDDTVPDTEYEEANTYLEAEADLLKMKVFSLDGSAFPHDTMLQLRSMEDMAESEEDAEMYRDMLLTPLSEALAEQYMEYHTETVWTDDLIYYLYQAAKDTIITFEPLEIQFLYTDGSSYEPGEISLEMTIHDQEIQQRSVHEESYIFPLWYDTSLTVKIPADSEYEISEKDAALQMHLSNVYEPSFIAAAEIDRTKVEQLTETVLRLKEAEESTQNQETESESESEAESESDSGQDYAYTRPGTPCKASSAYTKVTNGSRTFSSAYTFLRGTSKSTTTMWYDSSVVTKGYQESNGMEYLIPKSADARGKFGFRVSNVGYSTSARCNLDLYITVTKYKTYSLDKNGDRVRNVYPYVFVNKNLKIHYQGGLPDFELQCDIVKTGTTEKVPGNYRFMWTDIDGTQRYGFLPLDGRMDARYCLSSSTVNCGTETQFSTSYNMLYGQEALSTSGDGNCSVMYETSSMSSFKIFVGQAGDGTAAHTYSADTIKSRYQDAADGVYNASTGAMLGWNGSAYGPTALPSPLKKYVSNDGISWNTSNVLPSVTSEYWYALEMFVPQETSAYYYSQFQITDALPAGVDYVGDFSALKIETGQNISSFTSANAGDTLTFTASSAALNDSAFYGYTYFLKFKVKMDPTETMPAYNGTTAVYSVTNQASQTGKHRSDGTASTTVSNTVTTTASENRPNEASPEKWIVTASGSVKETALADRTVPATYEIRQVIPAWTNAWLLSTFEISDTLENCLEATKVSLYQNQALVGQWTIQESGVSKAGWTFQVNGQSIRMIAAGGLNDSYYGNMVRLVVDVKIKEKADLSPYYVSGTPELRDVEIPNQASSVFTWKNGSPASVTKWTNIVYLRLKELVQTWTKITLTKAILAEEIVWAHGNPTFTFCVEGTDLKGNPHKYYDTVEFTQTNTASNGIVTKSVEFEIPSGTYRAYETNVIRYRLAGIDGVQNGQTAGVGVNFTVSSQNQGAAIFHNRKTTDEKLSDTAFVRNTIIK